MDETELRRWLDLDSRGLEPKLLMKLLEVYTGPGEILDLTEETLRSFVPPRAVSRLLRKPDEKLLDKQLSLMEKHSIRLLPCGSRDYPRNLFEMENPPPLVFVKGTIEDIDALSIGIVGPRQATQYGAKVAKRFATDFAPHLTVISGAALGIDSTAHEAALDAGGRTIAVLGCGIDYNYPAPNERLRQRIADEGQGALLSVYPPGTAPQRSYFPHRNVVLAGLSLAVIIVEASSRSGALVTARSAGDEGRSVYAVPGDINRKNSEGSNALLRDGAMACMSAQDVIGDLEGMLSRELDSLKERRSIQLPAGDTGDVRTTKSQSPNERMLMKIIELAPVAHDELINKFVPEQMSLGDLSNTLLMMELDGKIEQLPGRLYQRKI